jgi:hypothetical protein
VWPSPPTHLRRVQPLQLQQGGHRRLQLAQQRLVAVEPAAAAAAAARLQAPAAAQRHEGATAVAHHADVLHLQGGDGWGP